MYKIITKTGSDLFECTKAVEAEVNKLCSSGWKIQGGVSITSVKSGHVTWYTIAQAMVKN